MKIETLYDGIVVSTRVVETDTTQFYWTTTLIYLLKKTKMKKITELQKNQIVIENDDNTTEFYSY
jgi:hypothetical protein